MGLYVPLGISSRLSKIECPSGIGPKALWPSWVGDTPGYQKKKSREEEGRDEFPGGWSPIRLSI